MRLKILPLWTLSTLFLALYASGQDRPITQPEASPSWSEIGPLLDRVSALPVEFSADLGLAILQQAKSTIPHPEAIDFLNRLFDSARTARYQTSFLYAGHNYATSSAATEAGSLRHQTADALSIQTRVVQQMLHDSPDLAAGRFADIQVTPKRATCADPTIQDLNSYYEALRALFADENVITFNGESRPMFLLDRVREAVTPEQIVPLLYALSSIDPDRENGRALFQIASSNLDAMTATGRELDALDMNLNVAMQRLGTYAQQRHVPLTGLAIAYRSFLVRSAATPTCEGDPHARKYTAINFNTVRRYLDQEGQTIVAVLIPDDVQTMDTGAAAIDPSVTVLEGLPQSLEQRLTRPPGVLDDVRPPPQTTEQDATAALATLTQQDPQGCDLCLFQAHIRLFATLTARQPAGATLRKLLLAQVDYISQNSIEQKDPAAYLAALQTLIATSRPNPISASSKPLSPAGDRTHGYAIPELTAEAAALREHLLLSNDPVLSTYMRFEIMFHMLYKPVIFVSAPVA
jgi:hypothetical protein